MQSNLLHRLILEFHSRRNNTHYNSNRQTYDYKTSDIFSPKRNQTFIVRAASGKVRRLATTITPAP